MFIIQYSGEPVWWLSYPEYHWRTRIETNSMVFPLRGAAKYFAGEVITEKPELKGRVKVVERKWLLRGRGRKPQQE